MKTQSAKKTRLAAALAVLLAPALASAQDASSNPGSDPGSNAAMNAQMPDPATARNRAPADVVRDPYSQQTNDVGRDAYREGLIWATYAANPALNAYRLGVDVQGDRAVLTGRVESPVDKVLAEHIAKRAQGVNSVDNRIQVDPLLIVAMVPMRVQDDQMRKDKMSNQDNSKYSEDKAEREARNTEGFDNDDYTADNDMHRDGRSQFSRYVADDTLAAMVNSRLLWSSKTDGTDIDVKAHDGVVTLTGRADSMAAKNEATRLAQATRGTVRVDNRLTVDANGQVAQAKAADGDDAMSDTWVAAKVNSSLAWSAGVDATDIDVDAKDGVVTLTGVADSAAAKRQAVDLAQGVRGVKRVDASGLRVEVGGEVSQR